MDAETRTNQNGAEAILKGPNGLVVSYAQCFNFPITNNMAEYEALINGVHLAMGIGVSDLRVLSDSQMVINQI